MKPQPKVHVRRPMPRREPSRLWEHVAAIGFGIAALMFVEALAR